MARITDGTVQNELTIEDPIGGEDLVVYYRLPDTEERIKYNKGQIKKKGKKIVYRIKENRKEWGSTILTGIRHGDFLKMVNGVAVPYSHDPSSPDYDPAWKNHIEKYASDVLEVMAQTVFENTKAKTPGVEIDADDDDADDGDDNDGEEIASVDHADDCDSKNS